MKQRKIMALLLATVMTLTSVASFIACKDTEVRADDNILAFPGAVGGGSYATGGRGGTVVHVTNLNDSGTGSFRDAVSQSNRIVVFDVGGTIELKSDVVVQSNITIAGQTAPGGAGITLKNYKLGLGGSNIICRFISSRPGERGTSQDYDAWGGSDGSNSIIDHCSIGWANDEQWGLYSKNDNYTVQYSVIGPANSYSYHSKGVHGYGVMYGRSNFTWDHNLIVHNVSRNVRGKVPGTGAADFTNNVVYNWGSQTTYGTIGHMNYVGNTLKKGNSTIDGHNYVSVGDSGTAPENYRIYLTGNQFLNKDGSHYSNFSVNNWAGIRYKSTDKNEGNTRSNTHFPIMVNGVDVSTATKAESAEAAYEHVLTYAGNGISTNQRTAVDQQVAYETRTGTGTLTGGRPKSEATSSQLESIEKYSIQCGVKYEYPEANYNKITDSDGDGMEDDWELTRGLNPEYAGDAYKDYCGQGYTNIEYYLNDLTVDAFPEGVVTLSPTTTTVVEEPVETFPIQVKSAGENATVNGNEITFNGKNASGNGVELENPFIGKDTSNGASVSFWLKPVENINIKDYNYISMLSFVNAEKTQVLKYDLGGTRQFFSEEAKLNYWEAAYTMTAGKEYYITCVMGTNGLDIYSNGIQIGHTGYANLEETTARSRVLELLCKEGSKMFAGGTDEVPEAALQLSKHRLPEGTMIWDVVGTLEYLNAKQAKTLYEQVIEGDEPVTSAVPSSAPTLTPTPTASPATSEEPSLAPPASPDVSEEPSLVPTTSSEPIVSPDVSEEPSLAPMASPNPTKSPIISEEPIWTPTPSSNPTVSEIPHVLRGDVDADGKLTINDAQMTLKFALKINEPNKYHRQTADVDENLIITLTDAQMILKAALAIIKL